jgi:hypothetical protein
MAGTIRIILAALGGFGIAIAVSVYYVLFHPDKAERVGGWIARAANKAWRKADRAAVALTVQSEINDGRASVLRNAPPGLIDKKLKVRWAKDSEEADALLGEGEVLVVMQQSDHNEENIAHAVMAYLPRALLPYVRRHLDRERMRAADLVIAKSILSASPSTEGALAVLFEQHLDPAQDESPVLAEKVSEMDDIDVQGWLLRILLQEYRLLGEATLNIRARTPAGCRLDAEEFARWVHRLATRTPGSQDVSLNYDGRYFRIAFIFIAIRGRLEEEGIRPYRRRAKQYIYRDKYDAVYLLARDWSIQAAEAVADELERDALVGRVERYRFPLRSDFRKRVELAREEAIVVCARRKGTGELLPPEDWGAEGTRSDDDFPEETYRPVLDEEAEEEEAEGEEKPAEVPTRGQPLPT